ncbi:Lrp/AsnC family transcriptional regulator [Psychrobium sp. MM17-31]|uniref:Lrp/AsnC family transcriptional regulator n=1 Tax=Psychrobium sp. MM17-31 TaxID=2917758 RepID=UPI001EF719C0|nr:Lrp/AsnC family transcriptional regulator [Psychrobium sp. MM17-31]MCG7532309.1 Lrp/AsnC family transcriptional regulator [Psychrobium sp. MM17-31]
MKLDAKDQRIIELLSDNARMPVSEIARQVHLSRTTVTERINRLQDKGVITGYKAIVNRHSIEAISVIGTLTVDTKAFDDVVAQLEDIPEVTRCAAINGQGDLFIELSVANVAKLDAILAHFGTIDGISNTDTNIVLNSFFQR